MKCDADIPGDVAINSPRRSGPQLCGRRESLRSEKAIHSVHNTCHDHIRHHLSSRQGGGCVTGASIWKDIAKGERASTGRRHVSKQQRYHSTWTGRWSHGCKLQHQGPLQQDIIHARVCRQTSHSHYRIPRHNGAHRSRPRHRLQKRVLQRTRTLTEKYFSLGIAPSTTQKTLTRWRPDRQNTRSIRRLLGLSDDG
jgi:hypothetical protein